MKRPVALALFLGACQAAPGAAPGGRPNVIVIITDDQGYGDLSGHGNPILKTPNLDRLRSESVRLTDFHAAPMCTPTRGQLLTGIDALRNGAMNVSSGRTPLRRGIPTLADALRGAGYRTGLFGKWHLGDNYPYRPNDRGFEEAVWFPSSHVGSAPDGWNNDYFDDVYRHNGRARAYPGYCTDVFFGEASRWIRERAARREPFFAYIATNAPHGPLYVPQKYRDLYKDQPRNVATFFGMIANIDENVGGLDALLRETGLRENTILVFLTDNGATVGLNVFNAGMRGKKIDLYDGGHRVPCFIRWPAGNLGPPRDVGELTQVQDLLPTILHLCGFPGHDPTWDGVTLEPLLTGRVERLPDRVLVIQFSRMNAPEPKKGDACVLWKRWRLVADRELYDLDRDPAQQKDVSAQHPDVVARLRGHYERWWAGVAPRLNEFSPVTVGSDAENPTLLSPCEWQDVFLDQSRQVRLGEPKNGAWNVVVDRDGTYAIELRRWPREADAPLAAGLPALQVTDGQLVAGKALPVAKARLKVADVDRAEDVGKDAKAVTFTVPLRAGRTRLQTWFADAAGRDLCGAYYVYVERK
jgi:arylsulfatase